MEDIFFELLQVAIGNRKTLSVTPTKEQWAELFAMAKKQALVGVAFAGVTKQRNLSNSSSGGESSDFGGGIGIDEMTYLKWLGLMAKTAQRNKEMTAACASLCKELAHDGLASCILKGQGNLEYYPEDLKECRTPGDIDVWCTPLDPSGLDIAVGDAYGKGAHYEKYQGIEAVIEYSLMRARVKGTEFAQEENLSRAESKETPLCKNNDVSIRYNNTETHDVWPWDVEIHHRPSMMNSFIHNARLQRWCKENAQFGVHTYKGFGVPTVSFNAVYQLTHIYTHLFDEGIGLRQLLDYYFVLRALHIEQGTLADRTESMAQWAEGMGIAVASNAEIMHTLGRFGMKKFAGAVMWVLQRVFAMPNEYLICELNEKEGRFLLNEIMMAGNFGKYDERIKRCYRLGVSGSCLGKRHKVPSDRLELPIGIVHAIEKTKHNLRLLTHYPEEVLSEPFFRLYHWVWRKLELWRF